MKTGRSGRLFLILVVIACLPVAGLIGCTSPKRRAAEQQYNQALTVSHAGRTEQAISALERATKTDPTFAPAQQMLAGLYRDKGDYARAADRFEALTKIQPKAAKNYSDLGLMQQLLGRLEQAAASYLTSLKLRPTDATTNMNLGLVYMSLGDNKQSVLYTRRAIELNPRSIVAVTNHAVALEGANDLKTAEQTYRRALELDGDKVPVLINYGGNLIRQNRPNDAIRILQEAIDANDSALLNKLMGDALALKGWPDAAIGRYERAIKLDPNYAKAHNALGDALITVYDRGMQIQEPLRDRALAAWNASLKINPKQREVEDKIIKWERK